MTVPLSYALGVCFKPVKQFNVAVDVQNTNYSQSEFTFANGDTTHSGWTDQLMIGVGIEYKPWDWLSVLGGYRNLPEVFVPDGAAIREHSPAAAIQTHARDVPFLMRPGRRHRNRLAED